MIHENEITLAPGTFEHNQSKRYPFQPGLLMKINSDRHTEKIIIFGFRVSLPYGNE